MSGAACAPAGAGAVHAHTRACGEGPVLGKRALPLTGQGWGCETLIRASLVSRFLSGTPVTELRLPPKVSPHQRAGQGWPCALTHLEAPRWSAYSPFTYPHPPKQVAQPCTSAVVGPSPVPFPIFCPCGPLTTEMSFVSP